VVRALLASASANVSVGGAAVGRNQGALAAQSHRAHDHPAHHGRGVCMSRFVLLNEAGAGSEGLNVVRWVVGAGASGVVHKARAQDHRDEGGSR
jgi:hypothetical protein